MGYGKRISDKAILVQLDQSYATVGKTRDISMGIAGDPGAILNAVEQAASGLISKDMTKKRQDWMSKLR
jgi:acetolactate synthase-1/2/3 large subunit